MLQVLSYPLVAIIFAVAGIIFGYAIHDAARAFIIKLIDKIKGKV